MVTAVCPNCKKQIDCLKYSATVIESGIFAIDGKCSIHKIDEIDIDDVEYKCPICDKVITHCEKEARIFLNGEEVHMNAVI
jgi:predicted RNA-binding Zn-ribbon protein involved in translation (DUF1610 family)